MPERQVEDDGAGQFIPRNESDTALLLDVPVN